MTWRADILTRFPEMFPGPLGLSLAGRGWREGFWSLARFGTGLGLSLEKFAGANFAKLGGRAARNLIQGSGDRR